MSNNYDGDDYWGEDDDFGGPPDDYMDEKAARNDRYGNAYGNYRGGYGPAGGYGPRPPLGFGPPPPNFMEEPMAPLGFWGRRGPGGPPGPFRRVPSRDERALRYLLRCGVSIDNLRHMPKEFFRMIHPQFCDLCNQNFPSPAISHMHYNSKSHMKNQRKWLNQRNDRGPRAKEVPFKARELYCELCDVHITSKSHADSHYAGKPHRAIVEGRKTPKNAALLQRNMHDRLEQLIRREKKNLKPAEAKEEAVPVEDPKPADPDLYCDICKTSVTCSDQMTMHLNGKRHLNKEKRHIFDMMKGKKEDEGEGEENEDEDDENGDNEGGNGDGEDSNSGAVKDEADDDIGNEEWHMDA